MEEFKKGDFVRIATGKIGVVIGECGNQIMIRLNDLSYCTSFSSGLEKIRGCFVPLDLSDAEVRLCSARSVGRRGAEKSAACMVSAEI